MKRSWGTLAVLATVTFAFHSQAAFAVPPDCVALNSDCRGGAGGTWATDEPYQVTGIQKWTCLANATSSTFAKQSITAHPWIGNNHVELGIMTGSASGASGLYRDWYSARRFGATYQHFFLGYSKPDRNISYTSTVRYDSADWRFFLGNTQVSLFGGPDDGPIGSASAAGTVSDYRATATGGTTGLSHQPWGSSTSVSGWVSLTKQWTSPFTASSVSVTANTAESHSNPLATAGCP